MIFDEMINKVIQGDCLEVLKNIPDNSIDLIVTDPPYNISQKNKISRDTRNGRDSSINLDFGKWDYDFNPIPFLKECKRILKLNGQIFVMTSDQLNLKIQPFLRDNCNYKATIIWKKTNPPPQFRICNYRSSYEMICWAINERVEKATDFTFNYREKMENRQNNMLNVWEYPICGGKERTEHPTQKPINLFKKIINFHSKENDLVLDPFLGSGTTAVACKILNRRFIGIELSPDYCKMAINRIKAVPERLDKFQSHNNVSTELPLNKGI